MKFKPLLIPTIITFSGLILLLSLGTWQMQRLQWKNNLIADLNERSSMDVIQLPSNIDNFDDIEYRRVQVSGEYIHDKEVHLFTGPKSERGRPGYNILTPLQLSDGRVVMVDRGWVETDRKKADKRSETLTKGVVVVEGMLHRGEKPARFTPDNDVAKNIWFWIDMAAIESYTGNTLQNMYVRALKQQDVDSPLLRGDAVIKRKNDHLQYAITWYGLAIILLVIYVLYHRQAQKN